MLQLGKHLWLNIRCDHPTGGAHQSQQLEREKTHTGSGLEHSHTFPNVRFENLGRILSHTAKRVQEEISQPPWTDTMRHQCPQCSPVAIATWEAREMQTNH